MDLCPLGTVRVTSVIGNILKMDPNKNWWHGVLEGKTCITSYSLVSTSYSGLLSDSGSFRADVRSWKGGPR